MDASDAREIKLQQTSASRLAELETSLPRLLWRSTANKRIVPHRNVVRTFVKSSKAHDLTLLLEPFQEWPQLLDPKLSAFLPVLIPAFLSYLSDHANRYWLPRRESSYGVIPLPRAVCKILYTLCKIRGEKVILQFLNNEPKYLEPMLTAYRTWNQPNMHIVDGKQSGYGPMTWEERYIMLLWLSHFILTPFDLSSISSSSPATELDATELQIQLPPDIPAVAKRVLSISLKHLESASKERESARALLVRLILRPDMLMLGLLDSFILWALSSLEPGDSPTKTIYAHIGVLSFLAGLVTSASKNTIGPFLGSIFKCIQRINADESPLSKAITASAIARKIIIKLLRAITVLTITSGEVVSLNLPDLPSSVLEDVIEHLLNSLADKDTPVRYAASKALSVIAVKLEPALAAEVVEAVIGSLEENLLWEDATTGQLVPNHELQHLTIGFLKRNLTAVDPLRWQGLVLTLSHLLYRRSPPPEQLPSILNALIIALCFEQRSSVGSSVGTNVRDAACFGMWAIARRYTTQELSKIDTTSVRSANSHGRSISVLQVMADQLIVAAALDPSGNIRRGASAALQELIGRHPDIMIEGISLVQTVDYHAVALRSKAIQEVAVGASLLDPLYWDAISEGLLEWRGVGSPDAPSRRLAATVMGLLAASRTPDVVSQILHKVRKKLNRISTRQVEERHGLLLSLAAIVRECSRDDRNQDACTMEALADSWTIMESQSYITNDMLRSSSLRPELTTEATCTMLSALSNLSAATLQSSCRPGVIHPTQNESRRSFEILGCCLNRTEDIVIEVSAKAAHDYFKLWSKQETEVIVTEWITEVSLHSTIRESKGVVKPSGMIHALGSVFCYFNSGDSKSISEIQQQIIRILVGHLAPGVEVESRVAAVRSLASGVLTCNVMTAPMNRVLKDCLSDYTTDQRGDVGSMVRVEAIDAVGVALKHNLVDDDEALQQYMSRICGLACEKLDKVRFRAWTLLENHWGVFEGQSRTLRLFSDVSDTSTEAYFLQLLSLCSFPWVIKPLLEGFLTSAGAGSESLLRSARAALIRYTEHLPTLSLVGFCRCFPVIIQEHMSNERLLVPALDTLGFLFDAGVMQRLPPEDFSFHETFSLIQKTRFKSGNVRKLEAAVNIYSGLATVDVVRQEAISKICNLLLHSFPKIRNTAADALILAITRKEGSEMLKKVNWADPVKTLKPNVQELRVRLGIKVAS